MNRIALPLTVVLSALFAAAASAQQSPSPLQRGAAGAMYGRCDPNMLAMDQIEAAAALSVIAPAALQRLMPAPETADLLVGMCAHQIHQHRCTAKIVAATGEAIGAGRPGAGAKPPTANPGAVFGGVAGGVLGLLGGNAIADTPGAVIGGAAGAWKGAQVGGTWFAGKQAAGCAQAQARRDAISAKLVGTLRNVSYGTVVNLLESNRRARLIGDAEATELANEAQRLATRAPQVLQAMR